MWDFGDTTLNSHLMIEYFLHSIFLKNLQKHICAKY